LGRKVVRKKKSTKKVRTFVLTVFSFCLIILITYVFTLNFMEIYNIYKEKQNLTDKIAKLETEEEKLQNQVDMLKDPEYIARYAREKFLYSKDGEFIIKMP